MGAERRPSVFGLRVPVGFTSQILCEILNKLLFLLSLSFPLYKTLRVILLVS